MITKHIKGDFKVIVWGASHKGMEPYFMEGVDSSRHHINILVLQLEEGSNT